jgi:hypothetical protein
MSRPVLLVIPSQRSVYEKTLVKNATAPYALLAYATIAALPVRDGRQVSVLDLNLHVDAAETLRVAMRELDPAVVGLTAVTPLVHRAREIARLAKELRPEVTTVLGGPHLSSLPKETMETCPEFDLGVLGEGDFTFQEILKGRPPSELSGVAWRCEDGIGVRPPVEIDDLDTLPFPEWSVYDLRGYSQKEVRARLTPVGWLETSRGCVYRCCYCNKNVFGRGFRPKSPERVAEEFKYFAKAGFRSINIADDNFTTNIDRAARICELLIRNGNRLPWATVTGIRVNGVTLELFELMKRAGFRRISLWSRSGRLFPGRDEPGWRRSVTSCSRFPARQSRRCVKRFALLALSTSTSPRRPSRFRFPTPNSTTASSWKDGFAMSTGRITTSTSRPPRFTLTIILTGIPSIAPTDLFIARSTSGRTSCSDGLLNLSDRGRSWTI